MTRRTALGVLLCGSAVASVVRAVTGPESNAFQQYIDRGRPIPPGVYTLRKTLTLDCRGRGIVLTHVHFRGERPYVYVPGTPGPPRVVIIAHPRDTVDVTYCIFQDVGLTVTVTPFPV